MTPADAAEIIYAEFVSSPALQALAQRRTKALKDLETAESVSAHLDEVKAALDAKLVDLKCAIETRNPQVRVIATVASTYAEAAAMLTNRLTGCVNAVESGVRTIQRGE